MLARMHARTYAPMHAQTPHTHTHTHTPRPRARTHELDTLAPTDEGEVPTGMRAVRELSELSDRDTFRVTHKVIEPFACAYVCICKHAGTLTLTDTH